VSRILCNGSPLPPEEWSKHVKIPHHSCLRPSSREILAIIDRKFYEEYIVKRRYALEVSYYNKFDE